MYRGPRVGGTFPYKQETAPEEPGQKGLVSHGTSVSILNVVGAAGGSDIRRARL